MGSSPIKGLLFPTSKKFRLFQEQLFIFEIGAVGHARLAFCVLTFTNKNIYIARASIQELGSVTFL